MNNPPSTEKRRQDILIALAIGFLAVFPRSIGLFQGIPDGLHPDEPIVVHRALYFASGDLNPHFFYYPSFSMYFTSAVIGLGTLTLAATGKIRSPDQAKALFAENPAVFYKMARLGAAAVGSLSVMTLFLWGKRFAGTGCAALAACLCAITPDLVTQAHYAKPDALLTWLGLVTFFATCEALQQTSVSWLATSVSLGALAFSTKYNAFLFLLPMVVAFGFLIVSQRCSFIKTVGTGGTLIVLFIAVFCLGTPYAVLDFHTFWSQFMSIRSYTSGAHIGETLGANHFMRQFISLALRMGGDPPLGGFFCLAALFTLFSKHSYVKLGTACTAAFLGFISAQSLGYIRYLDPVLPILIFCGVAALVEQYRPPAPVWRRSVVVLIVLALGCLSILQSGRRAAEFAKPYSLEVAERWILDHCADGSKIAADAGTPSLPLTKPALEDLAAKAAASGHIKGALFQLRLKYYDSRRKHFDAYLTDQAVVITPGDLLQSSRSVQRLVAIDQGLDSLLKRGFDFVVTSSSERSFYALTTHGVTYPRHRAFYESLDYDPRSTLLFDTSTAGAVGPEVRIYRLKR